MSVNGYFLARPGWNYDKRDRDIQAGNLLTWVHGRHELKGGSDLLWVSNDIRNDYRTMGSFEFNGATSGDSMADFLLGEVYQFWQGGGEYKKLHGLRGALFVQDEWRPLRAPDAERPACAGSRSSRSRIHSAVRNASCPASSPSASRARRWGIFNAGDPDLSGRRVPALSGIVCSASGLCLAAARGPDLVIRGRRRALSGIRRSRCSTTASSIRRRSARR